MSSLNKVQLIGRLGKDPEVRHLDSGVNVASFSLATSESYTNKQGEKVEQTEWHNIVAWGKLAEIIEKWVTKGMLIYIEGKLKTSSMGKKQSIIFPLPTSSERNNTGYWYFWPWISLSLLWRKMV